MGDTMSHKASLVFAITFVAFVSGCASPQASWRKEGISAEGARSALSECKYQVGLNKIPEIKQEDLIANCMEGKGFRSY
jgi:hypothetical protein